uniref:Trk system potassium transporter TrkA n=1 Tax=Anaerococcus mediterraneensis TaxID=1870984 RepID=UPI00093153F4|nr:Trk system potassium transporter TrkA [Anaerococcus mediterraneensis]
MNIIILGAGKVGSFITSDLANSMENHNIVVIDKSKEVLTRLLSSNDIMGLLGDGRDIEVLEEAGVSDCDLFIAVTLSDDVNFIASVFAKKMGAKNIMVRLRHPQYIKRQDMIGEICSAKAVINPEYIAAKDIQRTLKYSHALNVESFFGDKAIMMELVIDKDSDLDGKKISDLKSFSENYHTLIGIVNSGGDINIPHGDDILKADDKIYIIGEKRSVDTFYKKEQKDSYDIKNVMVVGAGKISKYLVGLLLEHGFNVTVIEIDKKRAEDIGEMYSKAVVINADGSNPELLEEMRIDHFDALISLTGIDEENILMSLLAQKYGVKKVIAKVNRTKLIKMTGIIDIDTTFAPKKAASDVITRYVRSKVNARGESISSLYRLEDDKVEVIEFKAIEHSKILDRPLKDLAIRDDSLVLAINHNDINDQIEVPNGDSKISLGDSVLVATTNHTFKVLDDILEKK